MAVWNLRKRHTRLLTRFHTAIFPPALFFASPYTDFKKRGTACLIQIFLNLVQCQNNHDNHVPAQYVELIWLLWELPITVMHSHFQAQPMRRNEVLFLRGGGERGWMIIFYMQTFCSTLRKFSLLLIMFVNNLYFDFPGSAKNLFFNIYIATGLKFATE